MADNEFTRINTDVQALPDAAEFAILRALERQYFKLCAVPGNAELSLQVIRVLRPLYAPPTASWDEYFEDVFSKASDELETLFRIEDPGLSPFLYQPEVLMIYDQLRTNEYNLRDQWAQHFPMPELERLAIKMGVSFD